MSLKQIIFTRQAIKKYLLFWGVIWFIFILRVWCYTFDPPLWDSATYVLMGKYLFSGGEVGLIEPFRPIVWPFILGGLWKLGLDPIAYGHILVLILSLGSILLVYCIGKEIFEEKRGMMAALFFSLSPSYFFYQNFLLTENPVLFIGLLSVWLFLKQKYFFSGMVGTLAFFTKFTQIIPLGILGMGALVDSYFTRKPKQFVRWLIGSLIISTVFFSYHGHLYGDILLPFKDAQIIYQQVSFRWWEGIKICLSGLFQLEGGIFIFIPLSMYSAFQHSSQPMKRILCFIGILSFLWIGKLPTEISRFFVTSLPYLFLLAADGFILSYGFLEKRKVFFRYSMIVFAMACVGIQIFRTINIRFPGNQWNIYQQYIQQHQQEIKGNIWIANPTMLIFSELKADEIMYYPIFDVQKIASLQRKIREADYIFYDDVSLPCRPEGDAICQTAKKQFLQAIKENFRCEWCQYSETLGYAGIFKRAKNNR
jgi:4-amino-4-deoxy-L-arabinose transferase-like glycosyltransferase